MKRSTVGNVVLAGAVVAASVGGSGRFVRGERPVDRAPRERSFRLEYRVALRELPAGHRVRVWLPVPPSNRDQRVEPLEGHLPACGRTAVEPVYGNTILYFETAAPESGTLAFDTVYRVRRREVRGLTRVGTAAPIDAGQRKLFLKPNRRVPTRGKPIEVLERLLAGDALPNDPVERARVLFDRVDRLVRYDKSRPGYGRGDAAWVCDSGFGNCTDFHSLFIAWARANGLPAKFEIGFPLPAEHGEGTIAGYHCWGYFYADGRGWIPVDISEADKHPERREYFFGNLTENRVAFTVGRDIELVPRQASGPLNFFVYPHVEVDGRVWPRSKTGFTLHFVDLPRASTVTDPASS